MATAAGRSSKHWIFYVKVLLTSTAIFSIAVILKLSLPVILQFLVSEVPILWSSFLSWLTPPYLYVVINGIIISIAASSRFYHKVDDEHHSETVVAPLKVPLPTASRLDYSVSNGFESVVVKSPVEIRSDFGGMYDAGLMKSGIPDQLDSEVREKKVYGQEESKVENAKSFVHVSEVENDGFVIARSSWTPSRKVSTEIPEGIPLSVEKPPASIRFSHRKTVKSSPEAAKALGAARALGVAKPKRHDTLETTWKTITDGRPIPLARHLKKSDTWETHGRHHNTAGLPELTPPKIKKSETFNERVNNQPPSLSPSPGSRKLKKEPSLSHDELNRRVEAFIKKFNEEMRLQRQESLNQYKEMVTRR